MTDSDNSESETAQEWFCPNCGDGIDAGEECESWPCAHCGTEMEPITRKSEYIPIGVLEELVDEFERRAKANKEKPLVLHKGIGIGRERSAIRVKEIIEEHK